MMLVCINNTKGAYREIPLTVGKIYETNGGPSAMYSVICDDGVLRAFSTSRFITVDECREKKLKELGIN